MTYAGGFRPQEHELYSNQMNADSSSKETPLPIYFVAGTRAQFIKIAPVMRSMMDQGIRYTLIYTAQHRENIQEILETYQLPRPDVVMYNQQEANTRGSFLIWFVNMLWKTFFQARKFIPQPGIVLTHGDTFTAWLAALMGKRAGCMVGHVESGCRSFNIFSPFPEEISRLITFQFSDIYFCADEWAVKNLRAYRGMKINMGANTMLDGVRYALHHPSTTRFSFDDQPFGLVSIHRYENIFTSRFADIILPILQDIARKRRLIFVLHPATRERLQSLRLLKELEANPNIMLHARFDFTDWINLCGKADFVITDGGSNQEELSYLGVPTLLFRRETERMEGLGENIVLSKFDHGLIERFMSHLHQYRRDPVLHSASPSEAIIQVIRTLNLKRS